MEGFEVHGIYGAHQLSSDLGVVIYLNEHYSIAVSSFDMQSDDGLYASSTAADVGEESLFDLKSLVKDGSLYIFYISEAGMFMNTGTRR